MDMLLRMEQPAADGHYADPQIYDILHTPGTAQEARQLQRIFHSEGGRELSAVTVLEPACGTGRLLRRFSAAGARVIGFDSSSGMIDYARTRLPASKLFVADMSQFSSVMERHSVDLAINTINTVRHIESDTALQQHFAEIDHVLRDDGRYIVGLSLSNYGGEDPSEDQWSAARGKLSVQQLIQYLPPDAIARSEQVLSHLRIHRPHGEDQVDSQYSLRAYDCQQWLDQVERSPLTCTDFYDLNGHRLSEVDLGYTLFSLARS